jgi:porin
MARLATLRVGCVFYRRMRIPPLIALTLLCICGSCFAQSSPRLSGSSSNTAPLKPNLETRTPPSGQETPGGQAAPDAKETASPEQTRPFLLTLPREHLWDDWGGLLPTLDKLGITPNLSYVADFGGNPSGGIRHRAAYSDNIGLSLSFDLEKEFGLEGGTFLVSMSQRDGASLSQTAVGNVFTIQQNYGGQVFHLIDVAYNQKLFNDTIELSIGRIAAGDDFLVSEYDYLFMQNGFDGNPVGIFFNSPGMTAYPNTTWGGRVKYLPTKRAYIMAGIYNGDSTVRANYHHGADFGMDGPVYGMVEAGYRVNGLPGDSQYLGDYKVGAWYDDNVYTDYRSIDNGGPVATGRGNYGVYALFDQVVLPFAEEGSNRGLGVFGSFLASPDQSISRLPYFCTGGVVARGVLDWRPQDLIGFGFMYGAFSDDLAASQQREQVLQPGLGVQDHETVLELTYRYRMHGGALFIQPDLQYIIHPGGTGQIQDAFVIGAQVGINF